MIVPLVAGAGVGVGVVILLVGLFPPRAPLAVALARVQPGSARRGAEAVSARPLVRAGSALARLLEGMGLQPTSLRQDLRVMGRAVDRHMGEKIVVGLGGALLAPAMAGLAALGGVSLPILVPLWAALVLGVAGFFVPDLALRSEADERRRSFRYALGSYFDLVVISLAGGGGVESALHDSAQVGQGWAYGQLQRALSASRLTRETPWAALGNLGAELGIAELCELAASVGLAGTEGARVRESLAAKARSLRSHELSEAEAAAESTSEKMSLPVVLLFVGFLVFLGYPAMERILAGI